MGLLFLAFSVAFAVNSGLGISPVNSIPYVLSLISGIELGTCIIAVFSFYVLLQFVLLRREFKWYNLFQLLFSTLFGYFTDFAKWVLGDFALPTFAGQLAMMAISIVLISIGVTLYVNVNLIPMPAEGLTLAIAKRFGLPFPRVKTFQDCSYVVISAVLALIMLGNLGGVHVGTVLSALLVGSGVKLVQKPLVPLIRKICFEK